MHVDELSFFLSVSCALKMRQVAWELATAMELTRVRDGRDE